MSGMMEEMLLINQQTINKEHLITLKRLQMVEEIFTPQIIG